MTKFTSVRLCFLLALLLPLFLCTCGRAQTVPERLQTGYQPLDEKLSKMVSIDSNTISATEAAGINNAIYLDARELNEYTVSHLPNAKYIGYNDVDYSVLNNINKNNPLVVYCTVGYRSERIANNLRSKGYTQVFNLYGSLYAWKLAGYKLFNDNNQPTNKMHTYNKKWGSYVPDSIGEKVY